MHSCDATARVMHRTDLEWLVLPGKLDKEDMCNCRRFICGGTLSAYTIGCAAAVVGNNSPDIQPQTGGPALTVPMGYTGSGAPDQ